GGAPGARVSASHPMKSTVGGWSIILAWSAACARGAPRPQPFGMTHRGEAVSLYTLKNAHGLEAKVRDYGGIIVSVRLADRNGRLDDVVLGFDSLGDDERGSPYFGAIIG